MCCSSQRLNTDVCGGIQGSELVARVATGKRGGLRGANACCTWRNVAPTGRTGLFLANWQRKSGRKGRSYPSVFSPIFWGGLSRNLSVFQTFLILFFQVREINELDYLLLENFAKK